MILVGAVQCFLFGESSRCRSGLQAVRSIGGEAKESGGGGIILPRSSPLLSERRPTRYHRPLQQHYIHGFHFLLPRSRFFNVKSQSARRLTI